MQRSRLDARRRSIKAYRRACLDEIGGLQASMGWDGIDEYSARARGWTSHPLTELVVLHSWDVAKATGQNYHADPKLAEALLDTVQKQADMFRQYQGFAAVVPVPDGASAFDRALSLAGRDPSWKSS